MMIGMQTLRFRLKVHSSNSYELRMIVQRGQGHNVDSMENGNWLVSPSEGKMNLNAQ